RSSIPVVPMSRLDSLIHEVRELLHYKGPPPDPNVALEREAFVEFMRSIGPPSLRAPGVVEAMLDSAEFHGMPTWQGRAGAVYDRARSWQCLFERWPPFFEADKRAHREVRARAGWVPEAPPKAPPPGSGPRRSLGNPTAMRLTIRLEARLDARERELPLRAF